MQNKGKQQPVELVHKPIITGSWHGKDAMQMAIKRFLSVLATTAIYLFGSILLSFDALWGRILMSFTIVGGVMYYHYMTGISQGETEAAYGEILYGRRAEGRNVPAEDCERSYHPFKGVFAVLMGALPAMLFAAIYAFMAKLDVYTLGVLPAWTEGLMSSQQEFAGGLIQYTDYSTLGVDGVMRLVVRAMTMPFVSVATVLGSHAVLLVERLSPLLVLIGPMGYGIGYAQGQHLRDQINTGIKLGDERKKKREMKARKKRQRQQRVRTPKGPERLV